MLFVKRKYVFSKGKYLFGKRKYLFSKESTYLPKESTYSIKSEDLCDKLHEAHQNHYLIACGVTHDDSGMEDKVVKLNVNHPEDMPGDEITHLYFSVLSKKQITSLYEIYELDFLLFNYTI